MAVYLPKYATLRHNPQSLLPFINAQALVFNMIIGEVEKKIFSSFFLSMMGTTIKKKNISFIISVQALQMMGESDLV